MKIPQFDSKNLELPINFNTGNVEIGIVESYLTEPINKYISKYEGEIRNTESEKIDVNNLKFSFREEGFKVTGKVKVEARKQIGKNPLTGGEIYTPWVTIEASFLEELSVEVVEGKLNISHSQIVIDTTDSWYKKVFDEFVLPYIKNEVVKKINEQLSNFNDMSLEELVLKYGKDQIKQKMGLQNVDYNKIGTFLKIANAGINRFDKMKNLKNNLAKMRVNARVSEEHLWLSLVKQ